jgi:hypothetical protein
VWLLVLNKQVDWLKPKIGYLVRRVLTKYRPLEMGLSTLPLRLLMAGKTQ